jgi:molybdate transport system substrate-binding protein
MEFLRICILCTCLLPLSLLKAADITRVAVASNLIQVFTELKSRFENNNNQKIELIFGSSGNFARQIYQGAPFHVFISANQNYVEFLTTNGHSYKKTRPFLKGRISYFIPGDSNLYQLDNIKDINSALRNDDFNRIAIANPDVAPYGIAAQQALQTAGLWVMTNSKLIRGESVAQTMQFAQSGGIDIAIIPASYSLIEKNQSKGRFVDIPTYNHNPIVQHAVLLDSDNLYHENFYHYLFSKEAEAVYLEYKYETIK